MAAFYLVLKKNLQKRKTFSFILIILSVFTAMFLVSAVGTIVKTQELYENSYDAAGEKELIYGFVESNYSRNYANHFNKENKVEEVTVTEGLIGTIDLGEEDIQTLFSVYNEARNQYTIFDSIGKIGIYLKDNEALVSMNFQNNYDLALGDRIEYAGTYLIVKGFYEDPICGSPFYHTKRILLSEEMFKSFKKSMKKNELRAVTFLNIGLKPEYLGANLKITLSELEENFEEAGSSLISFNRARLVTARTMVPRIILAILILFSFFLFCIMTIVIRYTILAAIEDDYASLGIMKAIGFKGLNITLLLLCQYLLVVLIGLVIGVIGAYAITPIIGRYLMETSGIVWIGNIDAIIVVIISSIFLFFVALIVYSQTRKAGKVKPIEAIIFGKNSNSSQRNGLSINRLPLSLFPISLRMGLKQLSTSFGQYLSLLILIVIFSFMILTVAGLSNAFSTEESVAGILGYDVNDLKIEITDKKLASENDVKALIKKIGEDYGITYNSIYETGFDIYANDSEIQLLIYNEFQTSNIITGNTPQKSDEIMISSGISEELGKTVGDKIELSLSKDDTKKTYEVVGINNQVYDLGRNITMSENGFKKLHPEFSATKFLLKISEHNDMERTIEKIRSNYLTGRSGITISNERAAMIKRAAAIQTTLVSITYGVIIISILQIALITFLVSIVIVQRETFNCGIMKSVGFTSKQIRVQFINRFTLIAFLGTTIGIGLNLLSDGGLVNLLFSIVNIAQIPSGISPALLLMDEAFIIATTAFCAWVVSRRIKKVNVRTLLTE